LREQNSGLRHKEEEVNALKLAVAQIKKDTSIVGDFLGLDFKQKNVGALGQGGKPSPDLSSIAAEDVMSSSSISIPEDTQSCSVIEGAQRLQADLQELVETVKAKREIWNTTPSILPLETDQYWLSSNFGWRRSPFTKVKEFHNGLDVVAKSGTPIVAPADGMIMKRGYDKYLGKYLRVDHGRGVTTNYGHLDGFNVSPGQAVKRGEVIAFMGNTGRSSGPHLHYQVKVNKRVVNPFNYILNWQGRHVQVQPPLPDDDAA
jgi:murein DD-endopeptidase MepM/ murein hydrolase activator NlpD